MIPGARERPERISVRGVLPGASCGMLRGTSLRERFFATPGMTMRLSCGGSARPLSVAGVDAVHDVHGDDDLGRARADRDGALGLRVRRHGDVLHVELLRGRCWRRGLFQRVDAGDEGAGEPRVVVCLRAGVVDGRLARLAHVWSGIRDVEGDAADVGRAGGYALIEDGADLLDVTDG